MRKLIVCNIVSLDGFYSGPNDDVMAMPFDTTFSEYNAERLRAADTQLLGRRSFEGFRAYWPSVADDSLTDADLAPWTNTTIVRRADAHDAVARLKEGPGREILVFGSRILWNDLLMAGLVDELNLMIGSALLGDGVPVFEGPRTGLRLLDASVLDGSQLILARYSATA